MLTQGGRRLNLAPGRSATVELPIYTPYHEPDRPVVVGDTIPLWSLDESTGHWTQEGSGTVVASADSPTGLAMRAVVGHFSWWNCDAFIETGLLDLDISVPDVAAADRVDADPQVVGDIDADPNLYRLGATRLVHIDARTADDSMLRQAGIDFEAVFGSGGLAADRAQAMGSERRTIQGATYGVATGLGMPAKRPVAITACAEIKRNGDAFPAVEACGTATVSIGTAGATVKTTIPLVVDEAHNYPGVTRQPQSTSVGAGQTATFSVEAARMFGGSEMLTYQWARNRVAIPGATSASYTTPPVAAGDPVALFSVMVGAPPESRSADRPSLTVVAPPPPLPAPRRRPTAGDQWVDAAIGNDANAGTAAAPLKTISAALLRVPRGGTVWLKTAPDRRDRRGSRAPSPASTATLIATCDLGRHTIRAVNPGGATIAFDSGVACARRPQLRG